VRGSEGEGGGVGGRERGGGGGRGGEGERGRGGNLVSPDGQIVFTLAFTLYSKKGNVWQGGSCRLR